MCALNKVLPHGKLEKLFENIWFMKGQVKMSMPPLKISKTMTVIKNPQTNDLTIINAMPLDGKGLEQLKSLGNVKNTLRIGGYHGRDDNFYKEMFGCTVYALKGHVYAKDFKDACIETEKGYFQADILLDEQSELPIPNACLKFIKSSHPVEAILHINQDNGILITADALHNMPAPDEFVGFGAKLVTKKMGFYKPYNVGPGWYKFATPSAKEVNSILDWNFEHVLPGLSLIHI